MPKKPAKKDGLLFTADHRIIVPLTVKDILDEEIGKKLA